MPRRDRSGIDARFRIPAYTRFAEVARPNLPGRLVDSQMINAGQKSVFPLAGKNSEYLPDGDGWSGWCGAQLNRFVTPLLKNYNHRLDNGITAIARFASRSR